MGAAPGARFEPDRAAMERDEALGEGESFRPVPNNSFKPSPLRGLGRAPYDGHSAAAANRAGLTQALGLQ